MMNKKKTVKFLALIMVFLSAISCSSVRQKSDSLNDLCLGFFSNSQGEPFNSIKEAESYILKRHQDEKKSASSLDVDPMLVVYAALNDIEDDYCLIFFGENKSDVVSGKNKVGGRNINCLDNTRLKISVIRLSSIGDSAYYVNLNFSSFGGEISEYVYLVECKENSCVLKDSKRCWLT